MIIQTTIGLKSKESDRRSEIHHAPNYGTKLSEKHVPLSFFTKPLPLLHSLFVYHSANPIFLLFKIFIQQSWLLLMYSSMDFNTFIDLLNNQQSQDSE